MIKAFPDETQKTRRRRRAAGISAGAASKEAKARSRNRRRVLTTLLGVGLIAECAAGALTSPIFYVRKVQMKGTSSLKPSEASRTIEAVQIPAKSGIVRFSDNGL